MLFSILSTAGLALAAAVSTSTDASSSQAKVRQVAQLANGTWLENMAVRENGDILATRTDKALVMSFDPASGKYSTVAKIPNITAFLGITEFQRDVFGVIGGNFTLETLEAIKGSFSIYKLDFSKAGYGSGGKPEVSILTHLPDAELPNGLAFSYPNTLFMSDTFGGVIYTIDTKSGTSKVAANNSYLQAPSGVPLGVNGLRFAPKDKTLYFTNSGKNFIGRIPVATGGQLGTPSIVSRNPLDASVSQYDDLAVSDGPYGSLYATTNFGNTINRATKDGRSQVVIAGSPNSTEIAGATAAAFGRTPNDKKILYAVTSGDLRSPIPGATKVGAQVLAIDVSKYEA